MFFEDTTIGSRAEGRTRFSAGCRFVGMRSGTGSLFECPVTDAGLKRRRQEPCPAMQVLDIHANAECMESPAMRTLLHRYLSSLTNKQFRGAAQKSGGPAMNADATKQTGLDEVTSDSTRQAIGPFADHREIRRLVPRR